MELETRNGYKFLVDSEDFELANDRRWKAFVFSKRRKNGEWGKKFIYLTRRIYKDGKQTTEYLHRNIINAPKGMRVDHINGNTLDFRRSNLRLCTHAENKANTDKYINNSSGFKGVCWHKQRGKWLATIEVKGVQKNLGIYHTKESAAMAYNIAAEKHFGKFAKYNMIFEKYNEPEESMGDSNRSISNG